LVCDPVITSTTQYDVVCVAQQAAVNKEHGIETAEPKKKKRKSEVMEVEAEVSFEWCWRVMARVVALVYGLVTQHLKSCTWHDLRNALVCVIV
jgi:hypothetical protein